MASEISGKTNPPSSPLNQFDAIERALASGLNTSEAGRLEHAERSGSARNKSLNRNQDCRTKRKRPNINLLDKNGASNGARLVFVGQDLRRVARFLSNLPELSRCVKP
ncbi:MAG: hypothetical protein IT537_15380 [Hyphomicrobiales bacterium]|nr:hypothetical protein [Hyphomicrobiales bacterium]